MNNSLRIIYRTIIFILGLSLITLAFSQYSQSNLVLAQEKVEKEKSPMNGVEQVLNDQVTAWNKGDLEGFMKGYWKSPELSFYSTTRTTKGWQETLDGYRKRYQSEGKEMGKLTFKDLQIEMMGAENAFVRGKWQVEFKEQTIGGVFTLIFKKFPDGWRIIHDHTS